MRLNFCSENNFWTVNNEMSDGVMFVLLDLYIFTYSFIQIFLFNYRAFIWLSSVPSFRQAAGTLCSYLHPFPSSVPRAAVLLTQRAIIHL